MSILKKLKKLEKAEHSLFMVASELESISVKGKITKKQLRHYASLCREIANNIGEVL